jgi:mono/diheme cytochrome c family protein
MRSRSGAASNFLCGYLPLFIVLAFVWWQGILRGQTAGELGLKTGKQIYDATCVGCHGQDGRGQPVSTLGFEPPSTFPDFSDCSSASREPDSHWFAMIHEGGGNRGFSPIMPAFSPALTSDEISKVVEHVRSFCADPKWPRGNLNLPRALYTEKAFPEDEVVLTSAFNLSHEPAVNQTLVIEKRLGARTNMEAIIPGAFQKQPSGSWFGGVGDISLELKQTLFHSLRRGSILALAGEARLPTGNASRGLGSGVTYLETFLAYDQILPRNAFVQTQAGVETPTRRHQEPTELFWRTAAGKSLNQGRGLGRTWSPMVEAVSAREMIPGARTEWDIVPQMQVTLNKRQHIRANFGVSIPVRNTAGRAAQLVFYLLWDFFDGGIRDGWK